MTVTVCVGSSCHLKGSREVIERFSELLHRCDHEEAVALKGCFCMERCGEGINWQVDDELISSADPDQAVATFRRRVLGRLPGAATERGEEAEVQ